MSRILLITHIYPPAIDGGSTAIAKIGEYLQKKNHEILVITSNCSSTDDFINPNSTPIYSTNDLTRHRAIIRLPVFKHFHKILKLFPPFHKGPIFKHIPIFSIIKFKPDFIIAGPLPTTIIIYAYFYKLLTNAQLLICPCYHPDDPDFNNPLLKYILKKANYLWCLTNFEKTLLNHPHTIVKGLGIDTNFLIKPSKIKFPKNPNILFIANFAAHKRTELLIQAYRKLKSKYPKLSLTLLGQKTLYFPKIEKLITPDIKTIFNPTREQIQQSIDQSTLLCLPSIHESFGIVFIESLARGKPVIGANTPQTTEVLNMLSSKTFKTDNLKSLISTIDTLISNPLRSNIFGYNYIKDNLTWDRIGDYLCQKIGL